MTDTTRIHRSGGAATRDTRSLPEKLKRTQRWKSFEADVIAKDRPLTTANDVQNVFNARWFFEPLLGYYYAITASNHRKGPNKGDTCSLADHQSVTALRCCAAAVAYGALIEKNGPGSIVGLKDHICQSVGPRAAYDPRTPEMHGVTGIGPLKGTGLVRAIEQQEVALGRSLTKPEKASFPRWRLSFQPAQAANAAQDESDNLDLLGMASGAWSDGHRTVLDDLIAAEESSALRMIMLDVLHRQRIRVCRANHGFVIWEAVTQYVARRLDGTSWGSLATICAGLGVEKADVEDVIYNLSRNLVSAVKRARPDLAHLLSERSRSTIQHYARTV